MEQRLLIAKIQELEQAAQEASRAGRNDEAIMFNRELIPLLLRLADAVRNSAANRRANSGER